MKILIKQFFRKSAIFLFTMLVSIGLFAQAESDVITYKIDCENAHLKLDRTLENGHPINTLSNLKSKYENSDKELIFAMNADVNTATSRPNGLYIEDGEKLYPEDSKVRGYGNFYKEADGVFYLTDDNKAGIARVKTLPEIDKLAYATESGPILVLDGEINEKFELQKEHNKMIRHGVGVMPDGTLVFAKTTKKMTMEGFAKHMSAMGCEDALYLGGVYSSMYLPAKDIDVQKGKSSVWIVQTSTS